MSNWPDHSECLPMSQLLKMNVLLEFYLKFGNFVFHQIYKLEIKIQQNNEIVYLEKIDFAVTRGDCITIIDCLSQCSQGVP